MPPPPVLTAIYHFFSGDPGLASLIFFCWYLSPKVLSQPTAFAAACRWLGNHKQCHMICSHQSQHYEYLWSSVQPIEIAITFKC